MTRALYARTTAAAMATAYLVMCVLASPDMVASIVVKLFAARIPTVRTALSMLFAVGVVTLTPRVEESVSMELLIPTRIRQELTALPTNGGDANVERIAPMEEAVFVGLAIVCRVLGVWIVLSFWVATVCCLIPRNPSTSVVSVLETDHRVLDAMANLMGQLLTDVDTVVAMELNACSTNARSRIARLVLPRKSAGGAQALPLA